MPKLTDHHSSHLVKTLYIGDSGTGKTGSLASLVGAGYQLKIIDLDNGLDALVQFVRKDHADLQSAVEFETLRDIYDVGAAGPRIKTAKAFVDTAKLLTKWPSDGSIPSEWGPKVICVIDSLTTLGKAAFEWAKGQNPGAKDPRQWYFTAQQALESTIAMLTSEAFNTNLIIISHVNFRELPSGELKGYASTIGSALGPTIPKYFNSMILAETSGFGKNMRRRIRTVSTGIIDLKNPAPFKLENELPLETGLATLFATLTHKDKDSFTMTLNFVDSLEKSAADIKRPPILPIGTYEWQIKKYEFDKSNDGKWEMCNFHLNCTAVLETVDADALADYGNPTGAYMRYTFMFDTEDRARFDQTLYRLKKFLTDHVKCWDERAEGSLKEGIANAVGHKFSGVLRWKADKNDPEVQYAEIARTAPV